MAIDRNKLQQTHFDDIAPANAERDSPIAPGEILYEEFLEPLDLSAASLARALHVPANRITAIINGRRSVSADTALRLARYFGTTPEFWMRLQAEYELREARRAVADEIQSEVSPRVA